MQTSIEGKQKIVLISNKMDFGAKKITRDRADYYIMIKGSI